MTILYTVMRDLKETRIFHCDIKLDNIVLSDNFKPKLFDYDSSIGGFTPIENDMDSIWEFPITGATMHYASPEVLTALLNDKGKELSKINPYKADLYSLGKTLICCITKCFNELAMLQTLYGENIKNGNYVDVFAEYSKGAVMNMSLLENTDRLKAHYYQNQNDRFVTNVLNYKKKFLNSIL